MDNKENYVDLFVPKGYANDDPNVFISINGKNYLLPKGKTSRVPPCVKDEFERSQRAQAALDAKSEALMEKSQQPVYKK
ncbi:MAG: hypothetical protein IKM00_07030 [Clostridia bacterium]|nr:hypothetical protein [Clostridia bacterium]